MKAAINVYQMFDTDRYNWVREIQNETYEVSTIFRKAEERYTQAEILLDHRTELGKDIEKLDHLDHRTLNFAYNMIAAEYRFRHEKDFEPDLFREHDPARIKAQWQEFYRNKIDALCRSSEFIINTLLAATYPNPDLRGKHAEEQLGNFLEDELHVTYSPTKLHVAQSSPPSDSEDLPDSDDCLLAELAQHEYLVEFVRDQARWIYFNANLKEPARSDLKEFAKWLEDFPYGEVRPKTFVRITQSDSDENTSDRRIIEFGFIEEGFSISDLQIVDSGHGTDHSMNCDILFFESGEVNYKKELDQCSFERTLRGLIQMGCEVEIGKSDYE